jgi:hypothetical protein
MPGHEPEESADVSVWAWLMHQALALAVLPGVIVLLEGLWPRSGSDGDGPIVVAGGLIAAAAAGYFFPRSTPGRIAAALTSALPLVFWLLAFFSEARRFGSAKTISDYFSTNITDNDTIATFFFTMPTVSSILYSAGAVTRILVLRRRAKRQETDAKPAST